MYATGAALHLVPAQINRLAHARDRLNEFIRLSKDAELSHWLVLIFAAICRTLMQAAWQDVG